MSVLREMFGLGKRKGQKLSEEPTARQIEPLYITPPAFLNREELLAIVFLNSSGEGDGFKIFDFKTGEIKLLMGFDARGYLKELLSRTNVELTVPFIRRMRMLDLTTPRTELEMNKRIMGDATENVKSVVKLFKKLLSEKKIEQSQIDNYFADISKQITPIFKKIQEEESETQSPSTELETAPPSGAVKKAPTDGGIEGVDTTVVEDPDLLKAIDKDTQERIFELRTEVQTENLPSIEIQAKTTELAQEKSELKQITTSPLFPQVVSPVPLPTSVGSLVGKPKITVSPDVSVLSQETATNPMVGVNVGPAVGVGDTTSVGPAVGVGTMSAGPIAAVGMGGGGDDNLESVSEFGAQNTEPSQDVVSPPGSILPKEGEVARGAVYHKIPISIFFDSAENPKWDYGLSKNILNSGITKEEALDIMNDIIDTEGSKILIPTLKSDGTIQELIEILQLHFSLHRQMSKGPRIPSVGIPLGALVGSLNAGGSYDQPGPGEPPVSNVQVPQTDLPTEGPKPTMTLAQAWDNRADWGGFLRNGPSSNFVNDLAEEGVRIKIYNEVGPGLTVPQVKGILNIRVGADDEDC